MRRGDPDARGCSHRVEEIGSQFLQSAVEQGDRIGYGTQPFIRIAYNRANSHRASQCAADYTLIRMRSLVDFHRDLQTLLQETITIPVQ